MQERPQQRLSKKDKLLIIGGAGAIATGAAALGSGFMSPKDEQKDSSEKQAVVASATRPSYDQLLRPMTPTEVIDLERRIATATTTPKPPDATATPTGTATSTPESTPTRTAIATPVYEPPRPSSERTFPTGLVERYGMINEQNYAKYFEAVTKPELEKLIKEQPDLPNFPFVPLSEKYTFGETRVAGTSLLGEPYILSHIHAYSPHLLIVASSDGNLSFLKGGGKFYGLDIVRKLSEGVTLNFQYRTSENEAKLSPKVEAPLWNGNNTVGRPIGKGLVIAEFFGSGIIDRPGKYSAPENQMSLIVDKLEKLPEPVKKGTFTIVNRTTYVTPSLSAPESWVHTKNGKIAVLLP